MVVHKESAIKIFSGEKIMFHFNLAHPLIVVYVKTQPQKLRKIGVNRMYSVLKIFFQLKILASEFSKISECNVRRVC